MTFQTTGIPKTPRRPDRPPRERRLENRKALIIIAVVVVIGFAWTRGTFDNFLWRVHLNYTTCAQNAFGATFCGDQLKEYQRRFGGKS